MAIADWFKPKNIVTESKSIIQPFIYLKEEFKNVPVEDKVIKFPTEIGVEHPFDFAVVEKWYKDDAFVTGIIDKFVDYTVGGGFYPISEDERAQRIIEEFIKDAEFQTVLRTFVRNGLVYGNAFMEIAQDNKSKMIKLANIDPKYMYIKRDNKGNIIEYNQWVGQNKTPIPFAPTQIAHFAHKLIGSNPYGYGVIFPLLYYLRRKAALCESMVIIMDRKANSPYVATVGTPEEPCASSDVETVGKKFEWLNNKHEWTFNHLVKLEKVDFGAIGDKFSEPLKIMNNELIAGAQVPEVLLGRGSIPEGLAKVQQQAFERRIQSIQEEVEKIIEQQVFNRVLAMNGLVGIHVELTWGEPSDEQKRAEIEMIKGLLDARIGIFGELRDKLEQKLAELMDFEEIAQTPEEERKKEEEQPQPTVPRKLKKSIKL